MRSLVVFIVGVAVTAGGAKAQLAVELGGGSATYKEDASIAPVESDWEGDYGAVTLTYGKFDYEWLQGGVSFGTFATSEETEKWERNGALVQRNDMDFYGQDLHGQIGWGWSLLALKEAVLVGYGYKRYHFDRWIEGTGGVWEKYDIHYADVEGRLAFEPTDIVRLHAGGSYGYVFDNEADNELLGTIEGDGGNILRAKAGVDIQVHDNVTILVSGLWERQELEGGTKRDNALIVEWPDNETETLSGQIGVLITAY